MKQICVALYTLGDGEFHGSYLAYPCVDFQEDVYEYYVISVQEMSTDHIHHSQVLLVGCENYTNVTIAPTASTELPLDAQTDSPMVTVASGSTSQSHHHPSSDANTALCKHYRPNRNQNYFQQTSCCHQQT